MFGTVNDFYFYQHPCMVQFIKGEASSDYI